MGLMNLSCEGFLEELASKAAAPGGGGASALGGAAGVALGSMVGSLTVGKKKYAAVEADIAALNVRAEALRKRLEALVQADAEAFLPVAAAYKLPKETPEQQAHKAAVRASHWPQSTPKRAAGWPVPMLDARRCSARQPCRRRG